MQELAPRAAGAPELDAVAVLRGSGADFCDQRRQHMARQRVEIVARSIEVGRHHRHKVAAMLAAIGLAQLEPGDLGDRVPLIGRFERAGQKRAFGNGLGCEPRINAGRPEKHQLADRIAPRRLEEVGLDRQIVVQKIRGADVVRIDAADAGRRQKHRLRPMLVEPAVDRRLNAQIEPGAVGGQNPAVLGGQPPDQRGADQPAVTRHVNALSAQLKDRVSHRFPPRGWASNAEAGRNPQPRRRPHL